ncbi:hypothetical protein ScPMuIL_005867 [Solemya velum]
MSSRKRVLCIGLVCVDMISVVPEFPEEDSDHQVKDYYWQRGGNASNTASVLALMGVAAEFYGTIAKGHELHFLQNDMEEFGILSENCVTYGKGHSTPVSIVIVSGKTGSRTILHSNKSLPEIRVDDFQKLDLKHYSWIHFEGRQNCEAIQQMLLCIEEYNKTASKGDTVLTSVEAEKPRRPKTDLILNHSDYVFISKEFARDRNFDTKESAVKGMLPYIRPGATVICAWGEDGAAASTGDGELFVSHTFPPVLVVDTLGAGDTFNGSCIYALNKGHSIQKAITLGCKVAGAKCGLKCIKDLKTLFAGGIENIL